MKKRVKEYPVDKYPLIDKFIPEAMKLADQVTEHIIAADKERTIRYTDTKSPEPYLLKKGMHGEYLHFIWNNAYINAMNKLTIDAGLRVAL
jgi:hypothetical protein|tara:strand:- start:411 stop:683 length:273 start_codon:yes stop_codon:yes gene_type:complete